MQKPHLDNYNLPDTPGIYFFEGTGGEVLYIGKATSLRQRVRSYFGDDLIATRGPLLVDMVTQTASIRWQETDSVLEALILESQLIKKHQPRYNSREKDDKSYWYVVITREDFPRVFLERGSKLDHPETLRYSVKATYGPYPSGAAIKEALKIIRKIFPFRVRKSGEKFHDRFYAQLGFAPTSELAQVREQYQMIIRHVGLFLQGKKKRVIAELNTEMKKLAKTESFEQAATIRNRISALSHINDVSLLKHDFLDDPTGQGSIRIEAYDVAHMQGRNMLGVMTVIEGDMPNTAEYRQFNIRSTTTSNDPLALGEVLIRRFKHTEWPLPQLIVMDGGPVQLGVAQSFLKANKISQHIDVVSVVKDKRHKPKDILGEPEIIKKYGKQIILLANSEAHRFSIKLLREKERKVPRKN